MKNKFYAQFRTIISVVAVTLIICIPLLGYAATTAGQELIRQLQAQSHVLQEKINAVLRRSQVEPSVKEPLMISEQTIKFSGDKPPVILSFSFSRDLAFGMRSDADVANLQEFLSEHGYYSGPQAGNFFLLTLQAVKKFQSASGISPTGYFGPKSRAVANEIIVRELGTSGDIVPDGQGTLSIEPSPVRLEVGGSIRIKAVFTPSRPACLDAIPSCEMPERAPYEVNAVFVSENPHIAVVDEIVDKSCDPPRACPIASISHYEVRGMSPGATLINASYTSGGNILKAKANVEVSTAVIGQGYISVEPSPIAVRTGESVVLHAYYQSPMPSCPTGLACIQMMPARKEITPEYTSGNPAIAAIERASTKTVCTGSEACTDTITSVKGVSTGKTVVTASFVNETGASPMTVRTDVVVTPAAGTGASNPKSSSSLY